MCVILHALKKKHVRKEEILQAMKANDAGFFMAALKPDGGRETIRTLAQEDAVKFFDKEVGDDDAFVMHARIPSRGTKTLDNVHGWEQDGVYFCHNMTLSDLDDVMDEEKWKGTDSEFFFRKVFMPFYKALGKDAYKDGKFAEPLDRLVRIAVQRSNKFLFIMPDNGVRGTGTGSTRRTARRAARSPSGRRTSPTRSTSAAGTRNRAVTATAATTAATTGTTKGTARSPGGRARATGRRRRRPPSSTTARRSPT